MARVAVAPPTGPVAVGATLQLSAVLTDAADRILQGRDIEWESENPAVARVNERGVVTGVAPGTATIAATSEGVRGSAEVTVVEPSPVSREGKWTARFRWPVVAVHLHLLPTGKVRS